MSISMMIAVAASVAVLGAGPASAQSLKQVAKGAGLTLLLKDAATLQAARTKDKLTISNTNGRGVVQGLNVINEGGSRGLVGQVAITNKVEIVSNGGEDVTQGVNVMRNTGAIGVLQALDVNSMTIEQSNCTNCVQGGNVINGTN